MIPGKVVQLYIEATALCHIHACLQLLRPSKRCFRAQPWSRLHIEGLELDRKERNIIKDLQFSRGYGYASPDCGALERSFGSNSYSRQRTRGFSQKVSTTAPDSTSMPKHQRSGYQTLATKHWMRVADTCVGFQVRGCITPWLGLYILLFGTHAVLLASVGRLAFLLRVCLRWFPALVSDYLYMPNPCVSS